MTNPEAELYRLQTLRAAGQLTDAQYQAAVALVQRGKLGEAAGPGQGVKLFTPAMVRVCTWLGGLGVGGVMIGVNLSRLGKKREAWFWAVGGFLVPVITITIALTIPALERIPNLLWNTVWLLIVICAYRTLLDDDLRGQPTAPNQRESRWVAFFYTVGCAVLLIGLLFGSFILFGIQ